MSLPLLESKPKTQNQRVNGYEVPDEDDSPIYRFKDTSSQSEVKEIIWAAYRQVFGEHLILEKNRQSNLESQLSNHAISVREFIRGLGKSDVYRQLVVETNDNYRVVDITFKRFLGRATYGKDEQIAWSIVIATKGLFGFIDAVVDSEEYLQNFGNEIVPYQRRRFQDRPFNLVNPRYSDYWRTRQIALEGRSYYPITRGTGQKGAQGIPSNFIDMARSLRPNERNYQRTVASVTSKIKMMELLDTTREAAQPQSSGAPTEVALPYRYLPQTPKV